MAWLPIANIVPQYADSNGDPYSGAVLKAYETNSTTNINFSVDSVGSTLVSSIALNAQGFPEVTLSTVIPHLNQDYKLALYPTQAAADADTGAIWTIDNIQLAGLDDSTSTTTTGSQVGWPVTPAGGAAFDGSNDYLSRTTALNGATAGKKGSIVVAVTFDGTASADEFLLHAAGDAFVIKRTSTGTIQVTGENSGGSTILSIATSNVYNTADTLYVIMVSWDLGTPGSPQIYINNTADIVTTTFTDDSLDYAASGWAVGATTSGATKLNGNLYSLWFDFSTNIDFSTEANRRLFLDDNNNLTDVGRKGDGPTGAATPLFFARGEGDALLYNHGTGGAFALNGTLGAPSVVQSRQHSEQPALVIVASGTVSAASSLDLTELDSVYASYLLSFRRLVPSSDGVTLAARLSTDNGATFITTSSYMHSRIQAGNGVSSNAGTGTSATATSIELIPFLGVNTAEQCGGQIWIHGPADSTGHIQITCDAHQYSSVPQGVRTISGGTRNTAAAYDAISFFMSSGNISSMDYTLYALRGS